METRAHNDQWVIIGCFPQQLHQLRVGSPTLPDPSQCALKFWNPRKCIDLRQTCTTVCYHNSRTVAAKAELDGPMCQRFISEGARWWGVRTGGS
jgi:hypothetical protein